MGPSDPTSPDPYSYAQKESFLCYRHLLSLTHNCMGGGISFLGVLSPRDCSGSTFQAKAKYQECHGDSTHPRLAVTDSCDHCNPDTGVPVAKFHLQHIEKAKVTRVTQANYDLL